MQLQLHAQQHNLKRRFLLRKGVDLCQALACSHSHGVRKDACIEEEKVFVARGVFCRGQYFIARPNPMRFVRMHCEQHHLISGQGGGQCGAGAPRARALFVTVSCCFFVSVKRCPAAQEDACLHDHVTAAKQAI